MADHSTRPNPLGQDALFATPVSLMLDARLTPLERNGWQVLRMLRSADGISPLANLGQLRRYLTTTPLGQRAGYETAWRAIVVLRLTGWISLVGQHRDPLTGHVLSELYQVHDSALDFPQACALDASLAELLQSSIGNENNQVDRVAIHIQATLAQVREVAPAVIQEQCHDDDDQPPPTPPSQMNQAAGQIPVSSDSARNTTVSQQTGDARPMTPEQGSTYKTYLCKKERTYRTHVHGETTPPTASMVLPPCLVNVKADQQRDVLSALRRLPPQHRQEVLDELQARSQSGRVRNVVAYFFALVRRVFAGEFRLWAGRREAVPVTQPATSRPAAQPVPAQAVSHNVHDSPLAPSPSPSPPHSNQVAKPASREVAQGHLEQIRRLLKMPPQPIGQIIERMVGDGTLHLSPGYSPLGTT